MAHPTLPLRRSRTLAALKTVQSDEMTKLQSKNQAEVDLLDDIRNFTKQRSSIEKDYAQSMLRLVGQFMQKRDANGHHGDVDSNRSAFAVWRTLLEESEKVYRARLVIAEQLMSQVSEMAKSQKQTKVQLFKKCHDLGNQLHGEMQQSIKEVTKAKKTYRELESVSAGARKSYHDAENRKRNKSMKLFQSKSQLDKKVTQAESKLELCEKRSTIARNDYLLTLAAVNAHQERYYSSDLPQLMTSADGDVFKWFKDAFATSAQLELDAAQKALGGYQLVLDQSGMVSREFELKCFLDQNPQFMNWKPYVMDPHKDDPIRDVTKDYDAEVVLNKEARKLASRIIREGRAIKEKQKAVRGLVSVSTVYSKTPEFGTPDAQLEVEQQVDELNNALRKSEIQKLKAEGRLEALRAAGIDVDQWIKSADVSASRENLLDVERISLSGSILSLDNSEAGILSDGTGANDLDFSSGDEFDDDATAAEAYKDDDAMSARSDYPTSCVVLYDYAATKDDELTIHEGETVTVFEADGSGWCKGRNASGQEGFFPESYVSAENSRRPSEASPPLSADINITITGSEKHDETLTEDDFKDDNVYKAVYSYDATCAEELTFPAGAIIKLLKKDTGVDDGWWEGSYENAVGVFPAILVERLHKGASISDDSASPTAIMPPPSHAPPLSSPVDSARRFAHQKSAPPDIAVTPPERGFQMRSLRYGTLQSSRSLETAKTSSSTTAATAAAAAETRDDQPRRRASSYSNRSPEMTSRPPGGTSRVRSSTDVKSRGDARRREQSIRKSSQPLDAIPDFDQFTGEYESYV